MATYKYLYFLSISSNPDILAISTLIKTIKSEFDIHEELSYNSLIFCSNEATDEIYSYIQLHPHLNKYNLQFILVNTVTQEIIYSDKRIEQMFNEYILPGLEPNANH